MPAEPPNPESQAVTAEHARNSRRLFLAAIVADAAACAYYGFTARVDDPLQLYAGLVIFLLASLPAILWARGGGRQLPVFEVLMLTTANCYALPLLNGHSAVVRYPPALTLQAALTVILFQVSALGVYYLLKVRPGRTAFFTREVLADKVNRYIGYGLTLTSCYTFAALFTDWIPGDLNGILRAIFYGIGIVAVFVQSRRWGLGTLGYHEKAPFIINAALQVALQWTTIFLVNGLSVIMLGIVGYVSGSRRIPFVVIAVSLGTMSLLHNGKFEMRARYWGLSGERKQLQVQDIPAFYMEWIECSLTTNPLTAEEDAPKNKLLDRTSLFHLLCLISSISPDKKPFLGGETYAGLPAQFVPRFFWPDKPVAHVGTYRLAVYYGLQREEDTVNTTIGFGLLNEAYANFGVAGAAMIGAFLGGLYKFVQGRCRDSSVVSYAGLGTIVLMAWSFQTEYTLSMWLSSMYQAAICILGIPFLIRNVLG